MARMSGLKFGDIRVFVSIQDYSVSVMNLERDWTFRMMNNDPTMGRVSGNVDAFVSDLTYMMMAAEFD